MDCSPPGSSVHGIFQARVLEWVVYVVSVSQLKRSLPMASTCEASGEQAGSGTGCSAGAGAATQSRPRAARGPDPRAGALTGASVHGASVLRSTMRALCRWRQPQGYLATGGPRPGSSPSGPGWPGPRAAGQGCHPRRRAGRSAGLPAPAAP